MTASALPVWAVVPATGIGSRMQADRPKQYLDLGGRTILERTLDRLLAHPRIEGAVLILSDRDTYWSGLNYTARKPLLTCSGGQERFHSVANGLGTLSRHLGADALVLIHDAVRPLVAQADLERVIHAALKSDDGAILGAPIADTVKFADASQAIVETRPRAGLWRAFTPQAFRLELIRAALQHVMQRKLEITDDASAMELMGYRPHLVSCDHRNIKITHPGDLKLAELLLASFEGDDGCAL